MKINAKETSSRTLDTKVSSIPLSNCAQERQEEKIETRTAMERGAGFTMGANLGLGGRKLQVDAAGVRNGFL
jgi:hypothetical protein